MLVPIIDDAHLMPADCLRKLRLLCEDFPRSHNLVLIGQRITRRDANKGMSVLPA